MDMIRPFMDLNRSPNGPKRRNGHVVLHGPKKTWFSYGPKTSLMDQKGLFWTNRDLTWTQTGLLWT